MSSIRDYADAISSCWFILCNIHDAAIITKAWMSINYEIRLLYLYADTCSEDISDTKSFSYEDFLEKGGRIGLSLE